MDDVHPANSLGRQRSPTAHASVDLNNLQKTAENSVLMESNILHQDSSISPHQDVVATVPLDNVPANGVVESPSKNMAKTSTRGRKGRGHWTHEEIIALFDAKKAQAERTNFVSTRRSKCGKWDDIAEFCRTVGVKRQPSQCRDKWEKLWPTFRKIMEWETQIPEGRSSYWVMTEDERDKEGFSRIFDKEIYDAMFARFSSIAPQNMEALAVSSPAKDDSVVFMFPATVQNKDGMMEDDMPVTTARKRRRPAASTKKVSLGPQPNEDTPSDRASNVTIKGNHIDPEERKAAIDARRLNLEERRFALEEKKLEATMEIGKGLIASMERMTDMISGLGAHVMR